MLCLSPTVVRLWLLRYNPVLHPVRIRLSRDSSSTAIWFCEMCHQKHSQGEGPYRAQKRIDLKSDFNLGPGVCRQAIEAQLPLDHVRSLVCAGGDTDAFHHLRVANTSAATSAADDTRCGAHVCGQPYARFSPFLQLFYPSILRVLACTHAGLVSSQRHSSQPPAQIHPIFSGARHIDLFHKCCICGSKST